jgi:hypothetical protein
MERRVSERLRAAVERDFDSASVAPVLKRLGELDLPLLETEEGRERVQAAIILIAEGRYADFERSASQAEKDWRDVLVAAGLANEDWPARLDARLGGPLRARGRTSRRRRHA